jgi:hypothetical protein
MEGFLVPHGQNQILLKCSFQGRMKGGDQYKLRKLTVLRVNKLRFEGGCNHG